MSLSSYNKKRNFNTTPEPKGVVQKTNKFRFVVQKHQARALHYDFRLELGGTLKSWAVPKGPSPDPSQKRLAVMTEDHPVSYLTFKGTIPEGNYGAGKMEIWDTGTFQPVNAEHKPISEKEALKALKKGDLKFDLKGKQLKGEYVLARLKDSDKNWLLIKHRDKEVRKSASQKVRKSGNPKVGKSKTFSLINDDNKKNESTRIGKDVVAITNRQKIYWPDEGYTKGDMIDYYDSVSEFILPHLKGRPLSLKRNPNGIRDSGFFHKDAGENAPEFVEVYPTYSESSKKTIDYIVCNNKASLLYVANLGCIEINPWNSTTKKPDHPTWLVIDIDPSQKNKFSEVVDTALATKKILDKAGIKGYCKTSGASGLHVYIPMKNKYSYEVVRDFAHIIASLVQQELPRITTLERSLSKRGPKIYIDFLQNRPSQTLAVAYSLRPVPGAHVSAPLDWKEVNHRLHPSQFDIRNMKQRLSKKGDLFKTVLTETTSIEKALKALKM